MIHVNVIHVYMLWHVAAATPGVFLIALNHRGLCAVSGQGYLRQ